MADNKTSIRVLPTLSPEQARAQQAYNAFPSRETWLTVAVDRYIGDALKRALLQLATDDSDLKKGDRVALAPLFERARSGKHIPEFRVSCGFTGKGRGSVKRHTAAESWIADFSADQHSEIFIHPVRDDPVDVLRLLTREMIHVLLYPIDPKHGTRAMYSALCRAMELDGIPGADETKVSFREVVWTADGERMAKRWAAALGPYPHAKLDSLMPPKTIASRAIKVYCAVCGEDAKGQSKYAIRMSPGIFDVTNKKTGVGSPLCPIHGVKLTPDRASWLKTEGGTVDGYLRACKAQKIKPQPMVEADSDETIAAKTAAKDKAKQPAKPPVSKAAAKPRKPRAAKSKPASVPAGTPSEPASEAPTEEPAQEPAEQQTA